MKEYLNEEQYQKNCIALKRIGRILLISGIIVLAVSIGIMIFGFINFGNSAFSSNDLSNNSIHTSANLAFGSFGIMAIGGLINSLGFILTVAGAVVMVIAHKREIEAFAIQQTMPITKEKIEKMTPTISSSASNIAQSITEGIQNGSSTKSKKQ